MTLRSVLFALVLLGAGLSAACNNDSTSTTTPPTPVAVTETFAGTVSINGAFATPFTVSRAGQVTAQLTALAPDATVTVGLTLGTWNGSACQAVISNDTAKLASSVVGNATAAGTLCVRVFDIGQLSSATDYEVRVDHY